MSIWRTLEWWDAVLQRLVWTCLFCCSVVLNPRLLSANRVDFGLVFLLHKFSIFTPPPPLVGYILIHQCRLWCREISEQNRWRTLPPWVLWQYGGFVWWQNVGTLISMILKDWTSCIADKPYKGACIKLFLLSCTFDTPPPRLPEGVRCNRRHRRQCLSDRGASWGKWGKESLLKSEALIWKMLSWPHRSLKFKACLVYTQTSKWVLSIFSRGIRFTEIRLYCLLSYIYYMYIYYQPDSFF